MVVERKIVMTSLSALLLLIAAEVNIARADGDYESAWSGVVGVPADSTSADTVWCRTEMILRGGRRCARSRFWKYTTSGEVTDRYVHESAANRGRVTCYKNRAHTGDYRFKTGDWSRDDVMADESKSEACTKSYPYAAYPVCKIRYAIDADEDSDGEYPLPYLHRSGKCGEGIDSIEDVEFVGQLTGDVENYLVNGQVTGPLLNDTGDTPNANRIGGLVTGTDMGAIFHANGKLNFVFGDTFHDNKQLWRRNVLYYTTDFDVTDGIEFTGFEPGSNPDMAGEIIEATTGLYDDGEFNVIPGAGFAITDPGDPNRSMQFLWFTSWVNMGAYDDWSDFLLGPDFDINGSTFALNIPASDVWIRLDELLAQYPTQDYPVWGDNSHFIPGTVWFDRRKNYIYLFGVSPEGRGLFMDSPVRLARVKSDVNSILDKTKYEYWNGNDWILDENGDMREARKAAGFVNYDTGPFGSDADIIPGSAHPRQDLSVAYNAYADRWIMMFLNYATGVIELWQSEELTGQWEKVETSDLPGPDIFSGQYVYAPFTSDYFVERGGKYVYFLLSEWDPVYNVGLWRFEVKRSEKYNCHSD